MSNWYVPANWYWLVQDSSPGTQAWQGSSGTFVPLATADYVAFLAAGNLATVIDTFANLMAQIDYDNRLQYQGGATANLSISGSTTLTNPLPQYINITNTSASQQLVILPSMSIPNAISIGTPITISCDGASAGRILVRTNDGVTNVKRLYPGDQVTLALTSNLTVNGTFARAYIPAFLLNAAQPTNDATIAVGQTAAGTPAFANWVAPSGDVSMDDTGKFTVTGVNGATLPVGVANGGTGLATLTAHAVMLGEGTSNVGFATIGTAGRLLIDQGAGADPAFKAMSGDVTINSSGVTVLGNIPNDTPMAGDVLATNSAAPSSPASGKSRIYVDSTSKNIASKNDAGTVNHGVQTQAGSAHNWIKAIADDGSSTLAQPASTDLSDVVSAGSWTPSDVSGAGLSFSGVNVSYTKIGNMVFVYGRVTYPATGNTGSARIGGLPVAIPNQVYAHNGNPVISTAGLAFTIEAVTIENTSQFVFVNSESLGNVTNAQLSGATIAFNLVYPAS